MEFHLWSEIQNSINLFKPKTLDEAFNLALEIEVVVGPVDSRVGFLKPQYYSNSKPTPSTNFKTLKYTDT